MADKDTGAVRDTVPITSVSELSLPTGNTNGVDSVQAGTSQQLFYFHPDGSLMVTPPEIPERTSRARKRSRSRSSSSGSRRSRRDKSRRRKHRRRRYTSSSSSSSPRPRRREKDKSSALLEKIEALAEQVAKIQQNPPNNVGNPPVALTTQVTATGNSQAPSVIDNDTDEEEESETEFTFDSIIESIYKLLPDLPSRKEQEPCINARALQSCNTTRKVTNTTFPISDLVDSGFNHVRGYLLGQTASAIPTPNELPGSANSKRKIGQMKGLQGYKEKFYSKKEDPFQTKPPIAGKTLEEFTGVKHNNLSVKIETLTNVETLVRKSLLATSAVDVILSSILELEKLAPLTQEQEALKSQLFQSLTKAMAHSAVFQVRAIASSMLERRRAFVEKCPSNKIPPSLHEWLLLQPFCSKPNAPLFGDCQAELEKASREHNLIISAGMAARKAVLYKPPKAPNTPARGTSGGGQRGSYSQTRPGPQTHQFPQVNKKGSKPGKWPNAQKSKAPAAAAGSARQQQGL